MEKGVWIVFQDYNLEGKVVSMVFDHEADADLFCNGGAASNGISLVKQWYPIYQHGPQMSQSDSTLAATQPKESQNV